MKHIERSIGYRFMFSCLSNPYNRRVKSLAISDHLICSDSTSTREKIQEILTDQNPTLTCRYGDMILRAKELESWIGDFALPNSVWLGGFFNPQSFLTAIMQQTARKVTCKKGGGGGGQPCKSEVMRVE